MSASAPYECWSLAEAEALTESERIDGYLDGRAGDPEPGDNRSRAYQHGWWCGAVDGGHREKPAWMAEIARQIAARWREKRAA